MEDLVHLVRVCFISSKHKTSLLGSFQERIFARKCQKEAYSDPQCYIWPDPEVELLECFVSAIEFET